MKTLFNVPNSIGHLRVGLLFAALFAPIAWRWRLIGVSVALDTVDGMAARRLNQCTRFGAHYDCAIDTFTPAVAAAIAPSTVAQVLLTWAAFVFTLWLGTCGGNREPVVVKEWPTSAMFDPQMQFTAFGNVVYYLGYALPFVLFVREYAGEVLLYGLALSFYLINQYAVLQQIAAYVARKQ